MIGPEGAVSLLVSYLQANMPSKIAELRTRYGADFVDLPDIAFWGDSLRERLELAQYPAIEVQYQSAGNPKYQGTQGTQIIWQFPYNLRVYLTARGNGFEQVEQRRKRYYVAIQELVAFDAKLSAVPNAWVDFKSFRGQFFGVDNLANIRDNRSIAATYQEMTVMVDEMTEAASTIGTADTVVVSVHPANRG